MYDKEDLSFFQAMRVCRKFRDCAVHAYCPDKAGTAGRYMRRWPWQNKYGYMQEHESYIMVSIRFRKEDGEYDDFS